jgi:hypothetical protein
MGVDVVVIVCGDVISRRSSVVTGRVRLHNSQCCDRATVRGTHNRNNVSELAAKRFTEVVGGWTNLLVVSLMSVCGARIGAADVQSIRSHVPGSSCTSSSYSCHMIINHVAAIDSII